MFDRIAGVYDLDEHGDDRRACTTAGGPARRSSPACVRATACSTSRPAPATSRSSWPPACRPAARWSACDFSEAMLDRARAKAPLAHAARRGGCASSGPTRWRCPTRTTRFDAATVGFGARNFEDLARGLRGDGARRAPGRAGRGARDHDADAPAAVALLPALVRPPGAGARRAARVPSSGSRPRSRRAARRARASPTPTRYLPNSVKRFPGPARARRRAGARAGLARRPLPAHGRRDRRDPRGHRRRRGAGVSVVGQPAAGARPPSGDGVQDDPRARRRAVCASGWRAPSATSSASPPRPARRWRRTPTRRWPRAASACGRCWCCSRRESAGGASRPAERRGAARARRGGGRAGALGDARARRPDRRRRAAPRAPHGGRRGGPPGGGGDRRPAVLARVRRARAQRGPGAAAGALAGELGARRRRAAAARGRLRRARRRSSATCDAAS